MINRMNLDGRVALVTGGGKGLGAAAATRLAELGARIALVDRDADAAKTVSKQLAARGTDCQSWSLDVTDVNAVNDGAASVRDQFGAIDMLVNCAGIASSPGMPYSRVDAQDFTDTFSVNVTGIFNIAKACRDDLIASRSGRIVNLSSITGVVSTPYMPAYTVSKAAVISLTKVLARDLASHHVTANAVCPGFIWTPLWQDLGQTMAATEAVDKQQAQRSGREIFDERIQNHVPMRREQTADDIADLIGFLCTDAAANLTGQVIGVDGGVTI